MNRVVAFKIEIYDNGGFITKRGFIYANSFSKATKMLENCFSDGTIVELHLSMHGGPILVSEETFNTVLAEMEDE